MSNLSLNEYQEGAKSALMIEDPLKCVNYILMGLGKECDEVQGKFKKFVVSESDLDEQTKQSVVNGLGGVLMYLSALADKMGYTLEEVASMGLKTALNNVSEDVVK